MNKNRLRKLLCISVTALMTAGSPLLTYAAEDYDAPTFYAAAKNHPVNVDALGYKPEFQTKYAADFLKQIMNGTSRFYIDNPEDRREAHESLFEITFYYPTESTIRSRESRDENGRYYIEINKENVSELQKAIRNQNQEIDTYLQAVSKACYSLNRNTTDRNLVDQINRYVVNHFEYKITYGSMTSFVTTGYGQCYHFANLFRDMCNAMGIKAVTVRDQANTHAWNRVLVDGYIYTFDPTFTKTAVGDYSWMTHRAEYESGPVLGSTARPVKNIDKINTWQYESGMWRYYLSNGEPATGWQQITFEKQPCWFYFNQKGGMQTGWVQDGKAWYYMNSKGVMQTGWIQDKGNWYYLGENGKMKTGWQQILWNYKSEWFYFDNQGKMLSNTTVGRYRLNASGVCENPY